MSALKRIFHPTDLSAASETAFYHALRIAMSGHSGLTVMHVAGTHGSIHRDDFPSVSHTLEQWGVIQPGGGREAVDKLDMAVRKIVSHSKNPAHACEHYLQSHAADLVVLAVHQHAGVMRWLHHAVGTPVVRNSGEKALMIPHGIKGFVNPQDGSMVLRNILLSMTQHPHPQEAVGVLHSLLNQLGLDGGTVILLHVGNEADVPVVHLPVDSRWQWQTQVRQGSVVDVILQTARDTDCDLLVMPTEGRNGFLDALRGSTTEQVLQKTACPLLTVPL